jgi:urease accessory protein
MDTAMIAKTHQASQDIAPLLVWLSPSFPIGSYAYSHGVEWAVETGDIKDLASLHGWIAVLLEHGAPWSDAVLFSLAYKAAVVKDDGKFSELAELAAALSFSKERRLETFNQGAAFLAAVRAAWPCEKLELAKLLEPEVAFPIAVALAVAGHNLSLPLSLEAYLISLSANLVSAAVRLIPLGQTDGTKAVASLVPLVKRVVRRAVNATIDDIGGAAFRSDIASMRHETQYTRLFRS